jgi:hypothetical protein
MSDGSELCGGTGRELGRGAGRGTGDASTGVRSGFGVEGGGLGVLAGSAFSVRFSFGAGDFSSSVFFFFAGVGVAVPFAFGFGVSSSSSSAAFLPGDLVAFGFGLGVGVAFFFDFDLRGAGFGVALDFGVSAGVGDATARISSRAFFFFSSVDCARTSTPQSAAKAKIVPRKTRSRITGRERNRRDCAINPEGFRG